jgi:hypothetical protein
MIRYAGLYTGPSYGSYDPRDGLEGFTSLKEAESRFAERQDTGGAYRLDVRNLTVDSDWRITASEETSTCWPATTAQDTLELYRVYEDQVTQEPFRRLSAGERGGVVRKNY